MKRSSVLAHVKEAIKTAFMGAFFGGGFTIASLIAKYVWDAFLK